MLVHSVNSACLCLEPSKTHENGAFNRQPQDAPPNERMEVNLCTAPTVRFKTELSKKSSSGRALGSTKISASFSSERQQKQVEYSHIWCIVVVGVSSKERTHQSTRQNCKQKWRMSMQRTYVKCSGCINTYMSVGLVLRHWFHSAETVGLRKFATASCPPIDVWRRFFLHF